MSEQSGLQEPKSENPGSQENPLTSVSGGPRILSGIGKIGLAGLAGLADTNIETSNSSEDETMRVSWMIALALCFGFLFLPLGFAQSGGGGGVSSNGSWNLPANQTSPVVAIAAACCDGTGVATNEGDDTVVFQKFTKGNEPNAFGPKYTVAPGDRTPPVGLLKGQSLRVVGTAGDQNGLPGAHGDSTFTWT